MEIFRGVGELNRRLSGPVVTVGNFDGVHMGHQAILAKVIERARALQGEAVLYTFEPHPRRVLQPEFDLRLLETFDQKMEVLDSLGLAAVIAEPFDLDFAKTPPDRFVEYCLHERIGPAEVYVGYDFHFGRDREGSMRLLTERGPHLGFSVTVIPEISVEGRDVNSTRIRELLAGGEVEEAADLLGRPFAARGKVAEGDSVQVGTPLVSGGKVEARVLSQAKDRKVEVVKFRRRQNYRRSKGHRQPYTLVEIPGISGG